MDHQGILIDVAAGPRKQDGEVESKSGPVCWLVWNSEIAKITCFGPGKFSPGCVLEALKNDCLFIALESYWYKEKASWKRKSANQGLGLYVL